MGDIIIVTVTGPPRRRMGDTFPERETWSESIETKSFLGSLTETFQSTNRGTGTSLSISSYYLCVKMPWTSVKGLCGFPDFGGDVFNGSRVTFNVCTETLHTIPTGS